MITKALIIDEPWLSKILNGEKDWEMRSTKCNFRGTFGLIRKGSGQVVGLANLTNVSGPYSDKELAQHFEHHKVGDEVVSKPDYKWRHAWEIANVDTLANPVRYVHKNGAVTWVELDDNAVEGIASQVDVGSPKRMIVSKKNIKEKGMKYSGVTKISAYGTRGDAKNYEFIAKPDSSGKFVLNKKDSSTAGNQTNQAKNKVYEDTLTEAANLLSTDDYLINLVASNGKRALRGYRKVKIV